MQARQLRPTGNRSLGIAAQILIWVGVLLLLVGGRLACPYVSSRLAALSSASVASRRAYRNLIPPFTPTSAPSTGVPSFTTAPGASTSTTRAPAAASTQVAAPALPTRLLIPVIGVDAPVVSVSRSTAKVGGQALTSWDVPARYAAGWHESSAPLRSGGNTVLNGHNTTDGEVFRDLYKLKAGDAIIVYSSDTPYTYAVSETLILREAGQPLEERLEHARYILPTDDERLTLVTCHPYGSLRYRLIVVAHPVTNPEKHGDLLIPAERFRFY